MLGKRDLVIAVSHGRGLRQTVEGLRQAREKGAYCVGITNTLVSPIGEFAHEFFLTSIATPSFGSSYVAPMALFNVIVLACANRTRTSSCETTGAAASRLPLVRIMRIRVGFSSRLFLALLGLMVATATGVEPPSPPTYNIRMENTWIPMKDGIRLAVTLYMPDGGKAGEKFPAVLEYHPYRKDDGTAQRDYELYSYFVRRGYVCARVDIRGFGASEGVPTGREYPEERRRPADHLWLAHQSWSNGNVGMMGLLSGFNSCRWPCGTLPNSRPSLPWPPLPNSFRRCALHGRHRARR
jgi:hypothetical protein